MYVMDVIPCFAYFTWLIWVPIYVTNNYIAHCKTNLAAFQLRILNLCQEQFACYRIYTVSFVSYQTSNQPKPAKSTQKHPQLAKTIHNSLNCLKRTKGTHYPSETLAFQEFLRQILECLVIRVTKIIEFERDVICSEFFLGKFCTAETSHCNQN